MRSRWLFGVALFAAILLAALVGHAAARAVSEEGWIVVGVLVGLLTFRAWFRRRAQSR